MHDRVEWIKPSDQVILQEFATYGGWLKPSSVYLNVGYSQRHVQKRCKALYENGVVERHETDVAYRLTDLGRRWLRGGVSADALRTADS